MASQTINELGEVETDLPKNSTVILTAYAIDRSGWMTSVINESTSQN